jgi:hypothetical protein
VKLYVPLFASTDTFATDNDHVTGAGDIAPGQVKTVEITFTPPAVQNFTEIPI